MDYIPIIRALYYMILCYMVLNSLAYSKIQELESK